MDSKPPPGVKGVEVISKEDTSGLTRMKGVDTGSTTISVAVSRGVGVVVRVGVNVIVGVWVTVTLGDGVLVGGARKGRESRAEQACIKIVATTINRDLRIDNLMLERIFSL